MAQEKQRAKSERKTERARKGHTEKNAGKYCVKSQFCLRGRQVERPAYASSCTSSPHPRLPLTHHPPATAGHCSGNEGFRRQLLLVPSLCVPQWGNGKTQIGKVIAVVGILFFCLCVPSFFAASVCLPFLSAFVASPVAATVLRMPATIAGGSAPGKALKCFFMLCQLSQGNCLPLGPAACCLPHAACLMLPVSPLRLAMLRF